MVRYVESARPEGAWCGDLVGVVVSELSSESLYCAHPVPDILVSGHWDDDGDVELIVGVGRDRPHARVHFVMEDDGTRGGWWSLCWQGCPGGSMEMSVDEQGARAVGRFLREFFVSESAALARAMVSGKVFAGS